ncbi:response regulator transcription factor [Streptomyces sp. NPDC024089]|uniref:response regulator transcription factor n=1 Tax=Streptomyces sp. NPDC024089 TaxID=3154328 RepID=UPI0033C12956
MSLRLIVAEDAVLLREGLIGLLQRVGHDIIAAVGDSDTLITATRAEQPDLIITDVRMPPTRSDDGLRAAVQLREEFPGLPVLVLSQYVERSYALGLLDSGGGTAVGYLLKERIAAVTDFTTAIDQIANGGTVVDPEVIQQLVRIRKDPLEALSPREHEVLGLIAQGHANSTIATQLFISPAAVNKHIGNIFSKLDLPTTTDGHRRVLAVLTYLRT